MSAPQSFDVTSKMSRIDPDLLRQAEAKFDAMFKASRFVACKLWCHVAPRLLGEEQLRRVGPAGEQRKRQHRDKAQPREEPDLPEPGKQKGMPLVVHSFAHEFARQLFWCAQARTDGGSLVTCFNCGKQGHKKSECRSAPKAKGGGKGKVKKARVYRFDACCLLLFSCCICQDSVPEPAAAAQ